MVRLLFLLLFSVNAFAAYPQPIQLWKPVKPTILLEQMQIRYDGTHVWGRAYIQYFDGQIPIHHCIKIYPTANAPQGVQFNTWVNITSMIWDNPNYSEFSEADKIWCLQ